MIVSALARSSFQDSGSSPSATLSKKTDPDCPPPSNSDVEDDELLREPALATLAVPGGVLRAYHNEGKELLYVVATCDCGHVRCKRQRTLLPSKLKSGPKARGRPIGFLAAWLAAGRDVTCSSRRRHQRVKLTRADRVAARERFKLMAGSDVFLDLEHDTRAGEDEEPLREP